MYCYVLLAFFCSLGSVRAGRLRVVDLTNAREANKRTGGGRKERREVGRRGDNRRSAAETRLEEKCQSYQN